MEFIDRESAYPNRYVMTDENGNTSYIYLERADEPTVPGTPLNAETFNNMFASIFSAIEDSEHTGCYYRMVNGDKEWINPPMAFGVEYRTTERWQSNPVYTALIDIGTLPDNSSKEVVWSEAGITPAKILRYVAQISSIFGDVYAPQFLEYVCTSDPFVTLYSIIFTTDNRANRYTGTVQIWYTK